MKKINYWSERQKKLNTQLDKDEEILNKKLAKEYDKQLVELEKEIGAYYSKYGQDNVIEYRHLLLQLSQADKELIYRDIESFVEKYPEYEHLMPTRESIYKLNRLEGLQQEIFIKQCEIGAITDIALKGHLTELAKKAYSAAGGRNLLNDAALTKIINKKWVNGQNFSDRVWANTEAVSKYMQNEFKNSIIRGDSYEKNIQALQRKFGVNRPNAKRLIYTEGTFVMNEASMTAFEGEYEEYEYFAHLDIKTSEICKNLHGKRFKISEREAGVNFPPMHVRCRSTYTIVLEKSKNNLTPDDNKEYHLNRNINRKDKNIGAFSNLKIPMQKREVRKLAKQNDISLKGITVKIQRSERLLALNIAGSTDYLNIGRIDLYPNAFIDEEQLIRTLIHEKTHVEQLKKYGRSYVQDNLAEMEKEAYEAEREFMKNWRK